MSTKLIPCQDLDRTPISREYIAVLSAPTSSGWLLLTRSQRALTARSGADVAAGPLYPRVSRTFLGADVKLRAILVDGTDANTAINQLRQRDHQCPFVNPAQAVIRPP